jgi:hypothetical protein
VGAYPGAQRDVSGSPGLEVTGDGRGCDRISGTFWIREISWESSTLSHLAATFEQHCDSGSALLGCIYYDAPDAAVGTDGGP